MSTIELEPQAEGIPMSAADIVEWVYTLGRLGDPQSRRHLLNAIRSLAKSAVELRELKERLAEVGATDKPETIFGSSEA